MVDCFQINYIIFRFLKEDLTEFDKMLYFQGFDGILYSKTSILWPHENGWNAWFYWFLSNSTSKYFWWFTGFFAHFIDVNLYDNYTKNMVVCEWNRCAPGVALTKKPKCKLSPYAWSVAITCISYIFTTLLCLLYNHK